MPLHERLAILGFIFAVCSFIATLVAVGSESPYRRTGLSISSKIAIGLAVITAGLFIASVLVIP